MSRSIELTAFDLAQRYVGVGELAGGKDHPLIRWWFSLCGLGGPNFEQPDETPWCSAFCQHAPYELRLPRSKSAAARSWLGIGRAISLSEAEVGFDVVILQRGDGPQPGPDVIKAPGHVGFYAGQDPNRKTVLLLGGNQGDSVSVAPFSSARILGIRRLL